MILRCYFSVLLLLFHVVEFVDSTFFWWPTWESCTSVDQQYWAVQNRESGLYLSVAGLGLNDNDNVVQTVAGLMWYFEAVDFSGHFALEAQHSGKSARVQDGWRSSANIVQGSISFTDIDDWCLVDLNNGYYKIKSDDTGKVMDVSQSSHQSGANVVQATYSGTYSQQWKLVTKIIRDDCVKIPQGKYQIQNRASLKLLAVKDAGLNDFDNVIQASRGTIWDVALTDTPFFQLTAEQSGKSLSIADGTYTNGANVFQFRPSSQYNDDWCFVSVGNGYYKIENRLSTKVLEVAGSSNESGANVQQYEYSGTFNQQWQLLAPGEYVESWTDCVSIAEGYYELQSKASGLFLAVENNGINDYDNVIQSSRPTVWYFSFTDAPLLQLTADQSGKSLTVQGASYANGANIIQFTPGSGYNDDWCFVDAGGGYYRIESRQSEKVVEVADPILSNGANVQQDAYAGTDNQLWKVVPAKAPPVAVCNDLTICKENTITKAQVDAGSFDLYGGAVVSTSISSSGPFPVGANTVILTVTDNDGQTATCRSTVTVRNCNLSPIAICKDLKLCTGDTITADQMDGGSSDSDGFITSVTSSFTGPFPAGVFGVRLTVTDNSGSTNICTSTITVVDCNQPPVAVCKDLAICTGDVITAAQVDGGSTDPDGTIVKTSIDATGPFPASIQTVRLTVTDDNGDNASCESTVNVTDCRIQTTAVCKSSLPLEEGATIVPSDVDGGSFAGTDNQLVSSVLNLSGPFKIGQYTVILTVTDNTGVSDSCSCVVEVSARTCFNTITQFNLIDAVGDVPIGKLGSTLDYSRLYLRSFNVEAMISSCPDAPVRSVLFVLDGGTPFCDRSNKTFALLGVSASGNYLGREFLLRQSAYVLDATPFTTKDCSGKPDSRTFRQKFRAVGPGGYTGCPGAPVFYDLYNAESKTKVATIRDGDTLCVPSYNVTIRANVIDCESSRVESVGFSLTIDGGSARVSSSDRPSFFLYGGVGLSPVGVPAQVGLYNVTSTSYSQPISTGTVGTSYTATFAFKDCRNRRREVDGSLLRGGIL